MTCGVYKIETEAGFYIGSSANVEKRVYHHLWCAERRRFKRSPKLYRSLAKHGLKTWSLVVVCDRVNLELYEQAAIDALEPSLNCSGIASRVEMTPEVREKIGAAHRRRIEIECQYCRAPFSVKPCFSNRKFCSAACASKGKRKPENVGAAISAGKRGKPNGLQGRPRTQATKDKIRKALRGRRHSPDRIEAIRTGRWGRA